MQHHWRYEKILDLPTATTKTAELKTAGKKVVTVNGAFDLLHAGHLDMLEEAKQQGEVLFVGINSDASIRERKGPARPIIGEQERAALLAALTCVDYVVVIDAPYDDMQNVFLRAIKPHVHANGAEYGEPSNWIEWPVMQEVGASGYGVLRRPGLATSDIIKKIQSA